MIEVLKQALEALESADWYIDLLEMIVYSADDNDTHEERIKIQQAITSLRQAIAGLESQEPMVTKNKIGLTLHIGWDDLPVGSKLYTHPPQRTWVGLDHHNKKKFSSWLDNKSDGEVFTAIEAKLKELNT